MKTKRAVDRQVGDFLNRWEPLPERGEDCPSGHVLVAFAKEQGPTELQNHVGTCKHCNRIIELLRETTAPGKNLYQLLTKAKANAQEFAVRPQPTIWSYVSAYLFADTLRWVGVVAASLLIIVAIIWGLLGGSFGSRSKGVQAVAATFPEDSFGKATEVIGASIQKLETSLPSYAEKQGISQNVKRALANVDRPTPQQRADLAALIFQYNVLVRWHNDVGSRNTPRRAATNTSGTDQTIESADINTITELFEIYVGNHSESAVPTDLENARVPRALSSVQAASRSIKVESISGREGGDEVTIRDMVSNRTPAQMETIRANIKGFADTSNRAIKVVSALGTESFVPGSRPMLQPSKIH